MSGGTHFCVGIPENYILRAAGTRFKRWGLGEFSENVLGAKIVLKTAQTFSI